MEEVRYATVSQALDNLTKEGYTIDFNLEEHCKAFISGKYQTKDFEIVKAYRYEGITDPADEATVYAIESKEGMKGVFVTGYGSSSDNGCTELIVKLAVRK